MPVGGHVKVLPRSIVNTKRQIWLTGNYILWKILRFSQRVACVDCVVLEAACTYLGNKQKVTHLRKCFDFVYLTELWKLQRDRGSFVRCYASNQGVHCLLVLPNKTSSATEPGCSSDQPTFLRLSVNKQHIDTRYSNHIHTIFTWYSIDTRWHWAYLFTKTHTNVNGHVCEKGYSGRCLFHVYLLRRIPNASHWSFNPFVFSIVINKHTSMGIHHLRYVALRFPLTQVQVSRQGQSGLLLMSFSFSLTQKCLWLYNKQAVL